MPGLSNELKQKMLTRQPRSIADAQRMEGMTPAALAIIVAHVRNAESAPRRGTLRERCFMDEPARGGGAGFT